MNALIKKCYYREYKYTYEEVENIVLQFNEKYNVAILIKDVCKNYSLHMA